MPQTGQTDDVLRGIALTAGGYGLFSMQDAAVKWLVETYPVAEVLFVRSLVILAIVGVVGGRRSVANLAASRNKRSLAIRAALILVAWFSFYTASRSLGLAELTTIYFVAPIIGVILAVFLLGEIVHPPRWFAVALGFVGVIIAAAPTDLSANLLPAGLAFFAACCWSCSFIMVRLINRTETTSSQMLASNGLFAVACAVMLAMSCRTPSLVDLALMIAVGLFGGIAQYLVFEGIRLAPASVVAPLEYTALIWAFLFGYLVWADIPHANVFIGALLIIMASLTLMYFERRRALAVPA